MFDRETFQTLVMKMDTNAITLAQAKEFLRLNYGLKFVARTKEHLIRKCGENLRARGL